MSNKISTNFKTKKGAASFYVVIFTTLVLGIITISFVRIMLSEATRTTDTDLNQSAYDSALAGVEDAKSALKKINQDPSLAEQLFPKDPQQTPECNTLTKILYGPGSDLTKDVQIAEKTSGESREAQAYTCVKMTNIVDDYRATLTSNTRMKVVPLRIRGGFSQVKYLKVSWYAKTDGDGVKYLQNKDAQNPLYFNENGVAESPDQSVLAPPVLTAELIQTDTLFNAAELVSDARTAGTDRSTVVLYPVKSGASDKDINADEMRQAADPYKNNANQPFYVNCVDSADQEFVCEKTLQLPYTINGSQEKGDDTAFLLIAAPYGNSDTKFKITALDEEKNVLQFENAQYQVDSTGRANDIYRRIETRLEIGNANFPFPEYTIEGSNATQGKASIWKNFWITNNCQTTVNEKIGGEQYGITDCRNSGTP